MKRECTHANPLVCYATNQTLNLPVSSTHPHHDYNVLVAYSIGRIEPYPANCRPHSSLPELTYGHPKLAFRAKWDSGSLASNYLLSTVRMRSVPQLTKPLLPIQLIPSYRLIFDILCHQTTDNASNRLSILTILPFTSRRSITV